MLYLIYFLISIKLSIQTHYNKFNFEFTPKNDKPAASGEVINKPALLIGVFICWPFFLLLNPISLVKNIVWIPVDFRKIPALAIIITKFEKFFNK